MTTLTTPKTTRTKATRSRTSAGSTPGETREERIDRAIRRETLTTGDVALLCSVAPRTACKWVDSGALPGFRVPGSQDRRVRRSDLVEFMKRTGIPLGPLARVITRRVLLVGCWPEFVEALAAALPGHSLEAAADPFSAGVLFEGIRPDAVVIDADGLGRVESTVVAMHCFRQAATVVLGGRGDVTPFHYRFKAPVDVAALARTLARVRRAVA